MLINVLKRRGVINAYFLCGQSLPVESSAYLYKGNLEKVAKTCSGWSKLTEELQNGLVNKINFI